MRLLGVGDRDVAGDADERLHGADLCGKWSRVEARVAGECRNVRAFAIGVYRGAAGVRGFDVGPAAAEMTGFRFSPPPYLTGRRVPVLCSVQHLVPRDRFNRSRG